MRGPGGCPQDGTGGASLEGGGVLSPFLGVFLLLSGASVSLLTATGRRGHVGSQHTVGLGKCKHQSPHLGLSSRNGDRSREVCPEPEEGKAGHDGQSREHAPSGPGRRPFQASCCRGLPVLKPRWAWGPRAALEVVQQGSAGSRLPFASLEETLQPCGASVGEDRALESCLRVDPGAPKPTS